MVELLSRWFGDVAETSKGFRFNYFGSIEGTGRF